MDSTSTTAALSAAHAAERRADRVRALTEEREQLLAVGKKARAKEVEAQLKDLGEKPAGRSSSPKSTAAEEAAAAAAKAKEEADAAALAAAVNSTQTPAGPPADEAPAGNATTEEWAEWVVKSGRATAEEVDGKGRDELVKLYGPDAQE